jgi:acetyl esterase
MPLDPDLKNLLKMMEQIGMPDVSSVSAKEFREFNDSASVALNSEEINVSEVKDMEIPVDGAQIKARLYSDDESRSLIIYFHGGGFVFGNLETHDALCRLMSRESGCRVLSVDYRLAPEHKFPTAFNDAYGAYVWVLDHSDELGISRNRIALCGDSAGGNLAAAISIKARDESIQVPALQTLFYPAVGVDFVSESHREFSDGYFLTGELIEWFGQQYVRGFEDYMDPRFSVMMAEDFHGLPETIVFTGEYDPLRDQGETFVGKLKSSGVPATGIRALGMIHGFASFFEVSSSARNYVLMASALIGHKLNNRNE